MLRQIKGFSYFELQAVSINNMVDLLAIVINIEGLLDNATVVGVILDVLAVSLESSNSTTGKIENLFLYRCWETFIRTQFETKDLVCIFRLFCKVDLILMTPYEMPSDHVTAIAYWMEMSFSRYLAI